MKKRSIAVRLGVVAMALTMVTTSMSSGTLAKYTAKSAAAANVFVARWHVAGKVTNAAGDVTWTGESTYSLGEMMSKSLNTKLGTTQAIDVDTNGKFRIAPGTNGGFAVVIDPKSADFSGDKATNNVTDVAVDYKISIEAQGNIPRNMKFSEGSKEGDEIGPKSGGNTIQVSTSKVETLKIGTIAKGGNAETVLVYWDWPYDGGETADSSDTEDGKKAVDGVPGTITIKMEMVQHDPDKGTAESDNAFYVPPVGP